MHQHMHATNSMWTNLLIGYATETRAVVNSGELSSANSNGRNAKLDIAAPIGFFVVYFESPTSLLHSLIVSRDIVERLQSVGQSV